MSARFRHLNFKLLQIFSPQIINRLSLMKTSRISKRSEIWIDDLKPPKMKVETLKFSLRLAYVFATKQHCHPTRPSNSEWYLVPRSFPSKAWNLASRVPLFSFNLFFFQNALFLFEAKWGVLETRMTQCILSNPISGCRFIKMHQFTDSIHTMYRACYTDLFHNGDQI